MSEVSDTASVCRSGTLYIIVVLNVCIKVYICTYMCWLITGTPLDPVAVPARETRCSTRMRPEWWVGGYITLLLTSQVCLYE